MNKINLFKVVKANRKALAVSVLLVLCLGMFVGLVKIPTVKATTAYFGKTAVGASSTGFGEPATYGSNFTCTQSGNLTIISAYLYAVDGTAQCKAEIFGVSVGLPVLPLLASSANVTVTSEGWYNFTITGGYLVTNNVMYHLDIASDTNPRAFYDTATACGGYARYDFDVTGLYWASGDFQFSIYATVEDLETPATDWNWMGGDLSGMYNVTAASGDCDDMQLAVDDVVENGTFPSAGYGNVFVPAGNFSGWLNSRLNVTGGVNIFGASAAGCQDHAANWADYTPTTILHNPSTDLTSGVMIYVDGINGKNTRIAGLQLEGTPPASPAVEMATAVYGGIQFRNTIGNGSRVDHCTFVNFAGTDVYFNRYIDSHNNVTRLLIDHCVSNKAYKTDNSWVWGYGFYVDSQIMPSPGDNYWNDSTPQQYFGKWDTLPTGSAVMYIEDCHMIKNRHAFDAIQGGFYCARFNLIEGQENNAYVAGAIDMHGSADWMSGKGCEAYNNTMIGDPTGSNLWMLQLRDGSALFYNNNMTISKNDVNSYIVVLSDDDLIAPYTQVHSTYIWNNSYTNSSFLLKYALGNATNYAENENYFLRAPTQGQDGFTYTAYPYPHPLISGIEPDSALMTVHSNGPANYTVYNDGVDRFVVNFTATWNKTGTYWWGFWTNGSMTISSTDFNNDTLRTLDTGVYTLGANWTMEWWITVWPDGEDASFVESEHSYVNWIFVSGEPEPTAAPLTAAQRAAVAAFNNAYIALGLVALSLIVLSCFVVIHSLQSDDGGGKATLGGVLLLISSVSMLVVGVIIINSFESSMLNDLVLLLNFL